jgi:hypothetical protein
MWMGRLLLALPLPGAPGGRLLLSNADQDHLAVATRVGRGAEQWLGDLLLVLAFREVANRHAVGFSPAMDGGHVRFANLAEGGRRWDRKAALPIEERAHLADGLQLGHVRLQKDAIDGATGQGDVIAQQGGIIGHRVALLVWNARRLHRERDLA